MYSSKKTAGLAVAVLALLILSCGPSKKLRDIQSGQTRVNIMGQDAPSNTESAPKYEILKDTLKVTGENGEELFLMKAQRDEETGEMVASEVLDASIIVARFRHIAERHGKLDLKFQIQVPDAIRDSKWQLRIVPKMIMKGDTVTLHEVLITGEKYNKERMRKYELYNKLLASILDDYDLISRKREIEIFFERNLPEIYSMRLDSAYVTDEIYTTMYDVTQKEVIEHYGLDISKSRQRANDRRKVKADKMEQELAANYPLATSSFVRLDTLVNDENHAMVNYDYLETIDAKKGLRNVRMIITGSIYEADKKLATIAPSEPYTFYISTLAGFYHPRERYMKKVIWRSKEANTALDIQFQTGKSELDASLGNNRQELSAIRNIMGSLLQNVDYDLDSVIIRAGASPEGSYKLNARLSDERALTVRNYVDKFTRAYRDSLAQEAGFSVDEEGKISKNEVQSVNVPILTRSLGEDWETLDKLVEADTTFTPDQRKDYFHNRKTKDPDAREAKIKKEAYYTHMKDSLYPALRRVQFEFFLHRKGMVKDTIQTTEIDTVYRNGLKALDNMEYDEAVRLLEPYKDFNTAIAFMGVDRNHAAAEILTGEPDSAEVDYLFAIIWSRLGDEQKAVQYYLNACKKDHSFVHRGNLDPEISTLIKMYNLNQDQF